MKAIGAKEAASILAMSAETLRGLLKNKECDIPYIRFKEGGHLKFTRESLEKYLERKAEGLPIDSRRPKMSLKVVR